MENAKKNQVNLGKVIRNQRVEKGMNQENFAEMYGIGSSTLSRYEANWFPIKTSDHAKAKEVISKMIGYSKTNVHRMMIGLPPEGNRKDKQPEKEVYRNRLENKELSIKVTELFALLQHTTNISKSMRDKYLEMTEKIDEIRLDLIAGIKEYMSLLEGTNLKKHQVSERLLN